MQAISATNYIYIITCQNNWGVRLEFAGKKHYRYFKCGRLISMQDKVAGHFAKFGQVGWMEDWLVASFPNLWQITSESIHMGSNSKNSPFFNHHILHSRFFHLFVSCFFFWFLPTSWRNFPQKLWAGQSRWPMWKSKSSQMVRRGASPSSPSQKRWAKSSAPSGQRMFLEGEGWRVPEKERLNGTKELKNVYFNRMI